MRRFQEQGMSLVEVLVALVFVSLAVAMFTYFIDALRINRHATEETAVTLFARDYLESLKARWRSLDDYKNLSLAIPAALPAGYELEIKISNQNGELIYSYPGTVTGTDLSLLRKVEIRFIHLKDHSTMKVQTVITRPTPQVEATLQQNRTVYEGY